MIKILFETGFTFHVPSVLLLINIYRKIVKVAKLGLLSSILFQMDKIQLIAIYKEKLSREVLKSSSLYDVLINLPFVNANFRIKN